MIPTDLPAVIAELRRNSPGDCSFEVSYFTSLFDGKCATFLAIAANSALALADAAEEAVRLRAALKILADKVDSIDSCDHKRATCEEVGCIGHEVKLARAALDQRGET